MGERRIGRRLPGWTAALLLVCAAAGILACGLRLPDAGRRQNGGMLCKNANGKITMLPMEIDSGCWEYGHCQGIAVDTERRYISYSFTTALVKTDLQGNLVGTVTGLLGHLGCIAFNDDDGRLYGSLEYKNDAIGRGILDKIGHEAAVQDAFYMAVFDVEKIDRVNMDACADGVMKCVYLREVVDDYLTQVECDGRIVAHRYGKSSGSRTPNRTLNRIRPSTDPCGDFSEDWRICFC